MMSFLQRMSGHHTLPLQFCALQCRCEVRTTASPKQLKPCIVASICVLFSGPFAKERQAMLCTCACSRRAKFHAHRASWTCRPARTFFAVALLPTRSRPCMHSTSTVRNVVRSTCTKRADKSAILEIRAIHKIKPRSMDTTSAPLSSPSRKSAQCCIIRRRSARYSER